MRFRRFGGSDTRRGREVFKIKATGILRNSFTLDVLHSDPKFIERRATNDGGKAIDDSKKPPTRIVAKITTQLQLSGWCSVSCNTMRY